MHQFLCLNEREIYVRALLATNSISGLQLFLLHNSSPSVTIIQLLKLVAAIGIWPPAGISDSICDEVEPTLWWALIYNLQNVVSHHFTALFKELSVLECSDSA